LNCRPGTPPNPNDLEVYLEFISASLILGISDEIVNATINIRKQQRLKIPDAIIAATALVNDFTLIADNDKDFYEVPELKYVNPSKM
jgi:hypothetical protein